MKLITHQTGPEGREVRVLLIEEGLPIDREFYLGVVLDRSRRGEEAFAEFNTAIKLDPNFVGARNNLGRILAERGNSSPMRTPGTLVAMAPNSPRAGDGPSGLGSHVSCCGGPPRKNKTMQDLARAPVTDDGAAARA